MKKTYFLLFACLFLWLLSGTAQNSMNMPVTGSSVFYTCSGSVFDDGGMVNPYSCNVHNSILVVYSDTMQPGSKLSVTGSYSLEEDVDFLYIYEGTDTNGLLLYTCTGIGSLPPLYSMEGPFTLKFFTNDVNCEQSGFDLFFACSSCPSVPNIFLSDVTSTSAVVAWNAISSSSYELVCVTPNVSPYEVQPIPLTDTFYTVTGLNVNSIYKVYVRTVCGVTDYSPFNHAAIITTQVPAEIPYLCDFENATVNAEWTFLASSSVNRWCVGSAINNTQEGDSALYITNDHLCTYDYSPNSPSLVWAYRDIYFTPYEEYLLSFDWQCGGDQFYNIGMDVFIGDPAFVEALPVNSTDVPAGAVLLLHALNAHNWTSFQYSLGAEYAGTTKRLYFKWTNMDYYDVGNPGAIDNISIMGFNCSRPTTLQASNITGNTVDISFVPGHVSDTEWEYAIGAFGSNPDNLTPVTVSSTAFTISNLSSSSLYHLYIRTVCNEGTSDWSDLLSFRTSCGTISTLPYFENFDSYETNTTPACWIRFPYPNSLRPTVSGGIYYSPSRSLYFYTDLFGSSDNMIIAPPIDTSINMSTIKISFKAYGQAGTPIKVGVLTDPGNDFTFYQIETCTIATGFTWTTFEVVLNQYEGAGRYIGFKVSRDANRGYSCYVDNVKFETFSNCPRPEGIALSAISDVGATIDWEAGNTAEAWDVVYVAQYEDQSAGIPVRIENNEYQITTMSSNTHYDVYVRSVCEDGSVSNWSLPVSFRTNCHLYETPFNETFDAFAFPPACWERYTGLASRIFAGEDFSTTSGIKWERTVIPNGLPTPHAMVQVFTSYCNAWLVSPPIDLSNVENPMLNFNLALTQHANGNPIADILNGADDKFMVAILGANDQHWSREHSYVWDNTGNGNFVYNEISNEGEYISIPLSQYGSQVRVAFYAESTSQNANNDIHIDDIYVGEHVGCAYASAPVLVNSSSNAVTASWSRGFEEENWQLVYGVSGADIDTLTPITLQDTSYTITGLNPNTFYDVYIRSICTNNDTSRWSGRLKVLTAQANIAELPYFCNFENATENANWTLVNGALINKWVLGQAVENIDGGTHSLYVSDDNGVTNTYDLSSSSRVWAYRDFNFGEGLEYELSFDYKLEGEVFVNMYNQEIWYDYLSIYVGNPAQPVASEFPFSIPEGAVRVTKLANTPEWRRASATLPGNFTGTTKRIYFAWENNHYDGENPPAAVDNISLKPVFCRKPQSVTAENITAYEATITIENLFDESDWEVRYAPTGSLLDTIPGILVANSQSYDITDLTPDTEYEVYVRNICSDIDTSLWKTPIVFRTGCVSITELPYMENFDRYRYNQYPPCWGRLSGTPGFNDVELSVFNAFSEPNSIKLSPENNSYSIAITPRIEREIDSLALSFRLFRYINSDCFEVGVMTDPEEASTFVTVDTIEPSLIETWLFYEIPMATYEGTGKYIAFRSSIGNITELNTALIDNVQLEIAPDCYKPVNVNLSNVTTNSAILSWSERNPVPATSWTIEIGAHGFTPGTGTLLTVNTNPYLLTGLTPRTVYDVRVRSNCSEDTYSDWSMMNSFRTFSCDTASMCDYLFQLNSVHGYGWAGASLSVMANGMLEVELAQSIDDEQFTVPLCMGDTISLIWHSGTLDSTLSFVILDQFNQEVYRCGNADTLNSGFIFGFINNCGYAPCLKPTELGVNMINMDAQLSWTRGSDQDQSWVLEYKEQSADQYIVKNCNFTSYTILDILPDVMYEARVKTICEHGESEFTDVITFGITGIDDQILRKQVVLFPNPAHDVIELRISDGNLHVNEIGMYDVYGKLLKVIPLQDNHATINIQGLASGVYFVKLNCEQGTITKKFVKK